MDLGENLRSARRGIELPAGEPYLEDFRVGAVEIAPDIVAWIAARPGDDSLIVPTPDERYHAP